MRDEPNGDEREREALKRDPKFKRLINKELDKYQRIHREVQSVIEFYRRKQEDR